MREVEEGALRVVVSVSVRHIEEVRGRCLPSNADASALLGKAQKR